MSNLIDRQAAIQTALEFIVEYLGGAFDEDFQKELIERMNALPSAQPEQKTSRWISTDDGWDGERFVCSVCGFPCVFTKRSPNDNGPNFCPNCGSYMGEKKNV